jgi:hypothetical protein
VPHRHTVARVLSPEKYCHPSILPVATSAVGRASALVHQEMRTQIALLQRMTQYDPLVKGFKTIAADFEQGNCKKL